MKILVTGGAGYIGTHTCVELIQAHHQIVVVDNLSNSKYEAIRRVEKITDSSIPFYQEDVTNYEAMEKIFAKEKFDGIIHFAGLKCVPESVKVPLDYYQNNIDGTLVLLKLMKKFKVRNFVFSSSATVYGDPKILPIPEDAPLSATNPYGRTKLFIEYILKDLYQSDSFFNIAILRYFNPIGAHPSGLIGEDPNGIPNNLVPYVTQVAIKKLPYLKVNGNDYPTKDGTGVRDYIHVCDLARGHVLALEKLTTNCGLVIYNLGTGTGYSVLEIVDAFSKVVGVEIPYQIAPRRPGDIATCYADPKKAYEELHFKTQYDLKAMAKDAWNWQKKNPNGYE